MVHELESMRDNINKMMELEDYDKDELIKKSRNLDMCIVKYIRKRLPDNNENLKK